MDLFHPFPARKQTLLGGIALVDIIRGNSEMKTLLLSLLCIFGLSKDLEAQDYTKSNKDHIYVEFISDCNWLVYGLRGKIKLKAATGGRVGFRAWEPNRNLGKLIFQGFVIYRNISWGWRDYLCFSNSSFKGEWGGMYVNSPSFWTYAIHFNQLYGEGSSNIGAKMRVWGPCVLVRLYHGEAMITHGDKTFYVKVDENNYTQYPPWSIPLN